MLTGGEKLLPRWLSQATIEYGSPMITPRPATSRAAPRAIEPFFQSRRRHPADTGHVNREMGDLIGRHALQAEFIERLLVIADLFQRLVKARPLSLESRSERQLGKRARRRSLNDRIEHLEESILAMIKRLISLLTKALE